jgi:Predicted esterase of the alpha-beta hydrolase superfamily
MAITNNIHDTALIFEGGGMRASYTAGFLNNLLENEIYFEYVAGISAGSSHSVNYLSRDIQRSRRSFVDLVLDPNFGGWKSFFKGEGYFRAHYIYEETPFPDASLPFDIDTFMENPARLRIGAFDRESGELMYYSKDDIHDVNDVAKIVRSSSSMPIFMPPTCYNDHYYVDGGLGGGIALDIAKKDGLKKFFVVLSRVKGYRKKPVKYQGILKTYYRKYPVVAEALLNRHIVYNQTLEELEELESEGKAFLVYPDTMPVSSREVNYRKLSESYRQGYEQGQRDLPKWQKFLSK